MTADLPIDLRFAVLAISARYDACRMVSLRDLNDELPSRAVTRVGVEGVLQALADHGLQVVESDAVELLAT